MSKSSKILRWVTVAVLILGATIYSFYKSYVPIIKNFEKVSEVIDAFNEPVPTISLVNYPIKSSDISSCKLEFKNNGIDVFSTSNSISYSSLLSYDSTEHKTLNLTYSQYGFLFNAIKNCSEFLVDNKYGLVLQRASVLGIEETEYYTRIAFNVDISDAVKNLKDLNMIKNNLNITVTKAGDIITYKINNLSEEDQSVIIDFLNQVLGFSDNLSGYSIKGLSKKLINEYLELMDLFCQQTNITINIV